MGTLTKYELSNFDCSVFFETGTGNGASLRHARKFGKFKRLISVEIDKGCFDGVQKQLHQDPKVTLFNGSSIEALRKFLPGIPSNEKTFFFLDAHFPGEFSESFQGYSHLDPSTVCMPLESELRYIAEMRPGSDDIILVDDWRLYEDLDFENGRLPRKLKELTDKAATSLYPEEIFPDRKVTRILWDEGYLLISPKRFDEVLRPLSPLSQLRRNLGRIWSK